MLHPNIVFYSFEDFRCVEIDGVQRLHYDYEITCWNSAHLSWTYTVAVPCLLVWVFGAPMLAFLSMTKLYRDKSLTKQRTHWGFLANGFKDHYFYWEIIIIYRKVLILFISAYSGTFGKIT